jgi:hypothetical protein
MILEREKSESFILKGKEELEGKGERRMLSGFKFLCKTPFLWQKQLT